MALVRIKFTLADGATAGWMKINGGFVRIENGKGEKEVSDDRVKHRYFVSFDGPPRSSLDYEIRNGDKVLAKAKFEVSSGQVTGAADGWFALDGRAR